MTGAIPCRERGPGLLAKRLEHAGTSSTAGGHRAAHGTSRGPGARNSLNSVERTAPAAATASPLEPFELRAQPRDLLLRLLAAPGLLLATPGFLVAKPPCLGSELSLLRGSLLSVIGQGLEGAR